MNPLHHKRQLIILMTLLFFVSQACTDIYVPGLPQMTREFHTSVDKMTLTITIYTYSQAFFFLIIGVISDLVGRRKVLIPAILCQIIASFLISRTDSVSGMVLLRILQAVGSGAIYIVLRLVIKDVMDRQEQISAIGTFVTALPLSLALAPVVGAWIIHFWGWRACFSIVALIQAGLFVWGFILIQETHHASAKFRQEFSLAKYFGGYGRVLSDKLFISLCTIVCGVFAAYYAFISISSYMYIDQFHVASTTYSYAFMLIAAAYLCGNRIMLWLNANDTSSWRLIEIGMLVSALGLVFMLAGLALHQYVWVLLCLVTIGVVLIRMATAFMIPPIQVTVTHHFGQLGAHALGLLSCLQYMFAGFGSAVVAWLPFKPSLSLLFSSLFFSALSAIGLYFCPRRHLT